MIAAATEMTTHHHVPSDENLVTETIAAVTVAATEVHVAEVVIEVLVAVETAIVAEIVEAEVAEAIGVHVESEVMIEDLAQSEVIVMTKAVQIVAQGVLPVVMMVETVVRVRLDGAKPFAVTSERN